jgi:hypothetical protein
MKNQHDNVIPFRPHHQRARVECEPEPEPRSLDMERFPVDIRGNVTFGRLMSGLATVGLTVRIDVRSGRVVITDDTWE